jgi:PAS domain S-box-containing protein
MGENFTNGEYLDLEGRQVVGVGMRVDDLPLYVVEETPVAVAYGLSRALSRDLLKVCCCVAFFMLVAALLLARSIARPIVQLEKATARVVSGELDSKVELTHRIHDEIDIFALRFNEMITALKEDRARRQEAEASLASERERLMVTLRSIGDGVISTDLNGLITLMNRAAEEMTGWSMDEALGQPVNQVFQLIDLESGEPYDDPLAEVFSQGHHVRLDDNVALIARDGHKRQVADSGTPIRDRESNIVGVVLFFQDITARKRMEAELQQAEKIRSVGLLAGGIAHDFNNQLTGILGNIGLAKMSIAPESKAYSYLDAAENAAIRSSGLTQQLLTFAKGGAPVKQLASIADLLRETSKFILRGSAVDCRLEIDSDLRPLDFDEGQLNQVLNNLLINAMQAMPDGGIITIRAENYQQDIKNEIPLAPGLYVRIMISDQGIGMTQSQLRRIFEPYFTTKKEGRGLGLASSYSIIKNHDGFISVESEPDQGTTFTIYLPASDRKLIELKEKEESEVRAGGGRILVMDDEEMVRDVAGGFLRHLGFQPSFAADGREAVVLYQQAVDEGEPFAAVIMDLTIPGGMGGRECVQEILKINPQARVIVASGYSTDPIMADFRQYGFSGVIIKPYSLADFNSALQAVL